MGLEDLSPDLVASLRAARNLLEEKDLAGAMAIYETVLAAEGDNSAVLAAISGDLGSTGHVTTVIELVAPLYDPERHGPDAGLNLLQAYLAVGEPDGAQHMLDMLAALELPYLEERLLGFSNAISTLVDTGVAAGLPAPARGAESAAKGTAVSVSKPVWFYGLEPMAAEILPQTSGKLCRIAFTQFGLPGAYHDVREAMRKPEDEPARLSRALPVWLAEMFFFSAQYAPAAALAIVTDPDGTRRPAILDCEWTVENLRQLVSTSSGGLDYVFTGVLRAADGAQELVLRLWDTRKFRERKQFKARWTPATADAELGRLGESVRRFMEWRPCPDLSGVGFPPAEAPQAWVDALGASLGLFLSGKQIWPVGLLPPLGPTLERLAPLAAREPVAALAHLTLVARARALGIALDPALSAAPLQNHPLVAEAQRILGLG
jgi:hypothetical protein